MKAGKKLLTGSLLVLCAALLVLCSVLAIGWSKAAKTNAALPEVRNNGTAGNTDPAVLPYWLVWKGAEWDIYFVPFYNGKDGNSAFVRGGNLCSYFYQYPPIARIAGNHQL